jgi:hypothetical protein
MSALVKRKSRAHKNTVLMGRDAVQQGRDMPVITQVVCRTPVNRDRGGRREPDRLAAYIGDPDSHQLDLVIANGNKIRDLGPQPGGMILARDFVPQQTRFQRNRLDVGRVEHLRDLGR